MISLAVFGRAALIVVAAAAACEPGRAEEFPAVSPGPEFPLAVIEKITVEGRIVPPAAHEEGRLYFVTDAGRLVAVDVSRKAQEWDYHASHSVSRPVGLGRERVLIVDDGREVHCLDLAGRLLWKKPIDETPAGPIGESDGMVFVGTEEGSLIALRASDGEEVWRFRAGRAIRTGAVPWRDRRGTPWVLCGGDEGVVYFIDRNGRRRGHAECGGGLAVPPLLEGDRLYAGIEGDALICLNLTKRARKWRVKLTGRPATRILSDGRRLFFLTAQGVLMCLDKKSGSVLWWTTMSSRAAFDPERAGSQVLATGLSDSLACFSARDGKETGRFQVAGEFRSNPIWANPWILVVTATGEERNEALLFLGKEVRPASEPANDDSARR